MRQPQIAEILVAHGGADAEDQQQRHEQAERGSRLDPRGVEAALVRRCMLGDVNRRAAVFAAEREALQEAQARSAGSAPRCPSSRNWAARR